MTDLQTAPRDPRGTPLGPEELEPLRAALRGTALGPSDPGYDEARALWNGMIDRRPAAIARCRGAADVAQALAFARERGLPLSVRGGGHNIAGTAVVDDGLMIDLSPMRGVRVDPVRRTVRVEPGCTLGDVDRETQPLGLAVPTGIVSETGIAGLTLGGGFGWLTRKYGWTSDNLLSADVVTADGRRLVADEEEHPDLFWAIRGGGGNLGVVTSFEFRAHPLGPEVHAGMIVHPFEDALEVARFFREFTADAPEEIAGLLTLRPAPPAPFLPPEVHGRPIAALLFVYVGDAATGARALEPVAAFGRPLGSTLGPKPFTAFQTMLDAAQPKGRQYYWKSEYLSALTPETDRILVEHAARIASPHSGILLLHLGGAIHRVPEAATAAGNRDARYVANIAGSWIDPAETERHRGWVRACWEELRPHGTGGTYVNFLGHDDDAARVRLAYGANYERLARIKAAWDPDNLFRSNQNVLPRA